jgi:hypothetical protein
MERLDAGVYFEPGCIHFDQRELCEARGSGSSPRNMRRLAIAWLLGWLESTRAKQCPLFDEE